MYQAIEEQGDNVTTLDPLNEGNRSVYHTSLTKKQMQQACVVKPPIWHTCGASPHQIKGSQFTEFKGSLTYTDPVTGVQLAVHNLNELIKKLTDLATISSQLTPQQKIASVTCSENVARRLPSDEDWVDCSEEMKAQRKSSLRR